MSDTDNTIEHIGHCDGGDSCVEFGTLYPDGTYVHNVTITKAVILSCPYVIIHPSHYRPDGTCRCDDPDHPEMIEWEYTWDENLRRWL